MNRVLAIAILMIAVSSPLSAQSSAQSQSNSDQQVLLNLDKQWLEAEVRGDVEVLNHLWAANFIDSSSGGKRSKRERIADLALGDLKYDFIRPQDDYQVSISKETATITYHVMQKGQEKGQEISGQYRLTHVYLKKQGIWQAVASYQTRMAAAQTVATSRLSQGRGHSAQLVARREQVPLSVNPYRALAGEAAEGTISMIDFRPTNLAAKARGSAQVSLHERALLVRVRVRNLPPPSLFGVRRYTLWVYLPNYGERIYLGDLPVTFTSKRSIRLRQGRADSAFRSTTLPANAVFGGLLLTTEPVRYVPVTNKPAQPLLLALQSEEAYKEMMAGMNPAGSSTAKRVPSQKRERRKAARRRGRRKHS